MKRAFSGSLSNWSTLSASRFAVSQQIFTKITGLLAIHVPRIVLKFQSDPTRNGVERSEHLGAGEGRAKSRRMPTRL